jgi:thioredoxin-like negative regulator of GroEL
MQNALNSKSSRTIIPNVSFYKVNIDNNMELTANLGIKNIPTVIFFKNGIEQKRLLGNNPPQSYENYK